MKSQVAPGRGRSFHSHILASLQATPHCPVCLWVWASYKAGWLLLTEQDHRVRQLSVNVVTFNDPRRHIHVFTCTRRDGR